MLAAIFAPLFTPLGVRNTQQAFVLEHLVNIEENRRMLASKMGG